MDPLIFIGIIVIFSILDSVARKRRTGMRTPPPPSDRNEAPTAGRVEVSTYDADPSYDEIGIEEEEEAERKRAGVYAKSSETLIPKDLWEEIAGLMTTAQQSRTQTRSGGMASRGPAKPSVPRRGSAARQGGRPAPPPPGTSSPTTVSHGSAVMPGERVHQSHREYGTEPSKRSRSEQDGLDPLARSLGADEATVRQQLRGRSPHALRQAVILQEVLEAPAALRPDRFSD